jgi:uncharacterized repeat protein (TIGR03803 family)
VVFKVDTGDHYTVLYSFTGPYVAYPSSLILDAAGDLYGTTDYGSASGTGTVFKLDSTGKETVLYTFTGTDVFPSNLILDASGNLYGTTYAGGSNGCSGNFGCGTVFKLDPTGTETVLYSFTGAADGAYPVAGLTMDSAGNLYGTTNEGGGTGCNGGGCGVVFRLDTSGDETVLHSFTGAADGAYPHASLVRDAAGDLYGSTVGGGFKGAGCGSGGCGTIFKIAP